MSFLQDLAIKKSVKNSVGLWALGLFLKIGSFIIHVA